MVDFYPVFLHNLLQITVGNHISCIEKHPVKDPGSGIVITLEINYHDLISTRCFKARRLTRIDKQSQIQKFMRQNSGRR
jgi:hypothetical protein